MAAIHAVFLLAASNSAGRHISSGTGVGIIILVVIVAALAVTGACALMVWLMRGPVARRSHRRGQVGRV